jgi:hypothetical protein
LTGESYNARVRIAVANGETPPNKPALIDVKDNGDGFVFNKHYIL